MQQQQYKFSQKSLQKLQGVDNRLISLTHEVLSISKLDFGITCGLRTTEEQQKAYQEKKSQCDGIKTKSKHQIGLAIDIICYDKNQKPTWDKKYYYYIAGLFESISKGKITWGGWFSFEDCCHFELS